MKGDRSTQAVAWTRSRGHPAALGVWAYASGFFVHGGMGCWLALGR